MAMLSGEHSRRGWLISVEETIDEIAARALQSARDAEERAKAKQATQAGKVTNPPSSPQTVPTPLKNP